MPNWFIINITVLVMVIVLTGFIIPQILLIAFRKKLYDVTDQRKVHTHDIPRLGGIAFFPAILFTLLLTIGMSQYYPGGIAVREQLYEHLTSFCLFVSAVVVLYLVGMADDLIGVRFRAKFVAQFAAGFLVIDGGLMKPGDCAPQTPPRPRSGRSWLTPGGAQRSPGTAPHKLLPARGAGCHG